MIFVSIKTKSPLFGSLPVFISIYLRARCLASRVRVNHLRGVIIYFIIPRATSRLQSAWSSAPNLSDFLSFTSLWSRPKRLIPLHSVLLLCIKYFAYLYIMYDSIA